MRKRISYFFSSSSANFFTVSTSEDKKLRGILHWPPILRAPGILASRHRRRMVSAEMLKYAPASSGDTNRLSCITYLKVLNTLSILNIVQNTRYFGSFFLQV